MRYPARLLVLFLTLLLSPMLPVQAQTTARCFTETPFCIEGRVREFWEQNGWPLRSLVCRLVRTGR